MSSTIDEVEDRKKRRLEFERELWHAGIPPDRSSRCVGRLFQRLERGESEAALIAEAVEEYEDLEARVEKLRRSPRGRRMYGGF